MRLRTAKEGMNKSVTGKRKGVVPVEETAACRKGKHFSRCTGRGCNCWCHKSGK